MEIPHGGEGGICFCRENQGPRGKGAGNRDREQHVCESVLGQHHCVLVLFFCRLLLQTQDSGLGRIWSQPCWYVGGTEKKRGAWGCAGMRKELGWRARAEERGLGMCWGEEGAQMDRADKLDS